MRNDLCPNCFGKKTHNKDYCPHCGYDASKADDIHFALDPFTVLNNRYMLGRTLGAGGFGITYIAYDMAANIRVAVKEYFPNVICVRGNDMSVRPQRLEEAYESGKQKFYNEATLLNTLRACPCVVKVSDFFYANNTAYIVMEYIEGITLKKFVLENGGTINYELAKNMVVDIAMSLAQVHDLNVLHRDISPDNIMVCPDGHVKLIDFGASRDYVNNRSGGLSVILKPGFAPPEQYSRNRPQGPYTDVYALACTFYRAVTGVNVPDSNDRVGGKQMSSLIQLCPNVPQHVSDAVDKALALSYKNRTKDMIAFIQDITKGDTVGPAGGSERQTPPYIPPVSPVPTQCIVNIYYGNRVSAAYRLEDRVEYTIGRSASCSITVKDDMRVSRTHFRVMFNSARRSVTITDVSSYGTFWIEGGHYLVKHSPTEMPGGCTLQLSSSDIFVNFQL